MSHDAKRTGNSHSTLLDQLIKAAEDAAPKTEKIAFADHCIKIASEPPASLQDTLNKMAREANRQNKLRKQAQMDIGRSMGKSMESPMGESDGSPMGSPMGGMDGGMEDSSMDPDFDGMLDDSMEAPEAANEPDIDGVKQSLTDALISLCGGVEEAVACLQGSGGGMDELDEGPLDSIDEEEDVFGDDNVVPDDLLEGQESIESGPMNRSMSPGKPLL